MRAGPKWHKTLLLVVYDDYGGAVSLSGPFPTRSFCVCGAAYTLRVTLVCRTSVCAVVPLHSVCRHGTHTACV